MESSLGAPPGGATAETTDGDCCYRAIESVPAERRESTARSEFTDNRFGLAVREDSVAIIAVGTRGLIWNVASATAQLTRRAKRRPRIACQEATDISDTGNTSLSRHS